MNMYKTFHKTTLNINLTSWAINGARIEARRAQKLPVLEATDLMMVGYSSTTYRYSRLKASVQAIFPRFTNAMTAVEPATQQ